MKAFLKNYRQSPRKVRLVADLIRGKEVSRAQVALSFTDNKSAPAFRKLIDSAVANARQAGFEASDLLVKTVMVDEGLSMRRYMPRARGRATPYLKRTSRITLELAQKERVEKKSAKKAASAEKTAAKPAAEKPAAKKVAKKTVLKK